MFASWSPLCINSRCSTILSKPCEHREVFKVALYSEVVYSEYVKLFMNPHWSWGLHPPPLWIIYMLESWGLKAQSRMCLCVPYHSNNFIMFLQSMMRGDFFRTDYISITVFGKNTSYLTHLLLRNQYSETRITVLICLHLPLTGPLKKDIF
jgi:hypothetical protein